MPQRPIELITYGTLLLITVFWRFSRWIQRIDQRHVTATIGAVLLTGTAAAVHVALKPTATVASLIMLPSYFMGNIVYLTIMFPYADARMLLIMPVNLGLAYFAYMNLDDGGTYSDPLQLVFAYTVMAGGILYSRIYRSRREILAEYRARNQLLQTERLKVEVIEQQMELAKEIQDSLTPPSKITTPMGAEAVFLQKKYHPLGGDWMAVRVLDNGDTVFVVADVTGKGLGAALVVHALQSLWAKSLSEPEFDIQVWLDSVNRTLLTLGQKKPHTCTIGVLVLSENKLTYYSAGHVPCYVVLGRQKMRVILGQGNLVGFTDSLELSPVSMNFTPGEAMTVLLGTDGALTKGSRGRLRDILALIDHVETDPSSALNANIVDDDKMLIAVALPSNYAKLKAVG